MKGLFNRLLLALGILMLFGGAIKLFKLNDLDICDDDDLIENLSESNWTTEGGAQSIEFKDDNSFILYRGYSNDGIAQYVGTYNLLNNCNVPNDSDIATSRSTQMNFITNGELVDEIGTEVEFSLTSKSYKILYISGTPYYKESDFKNLTQEK